MPTTASRAATRRGYRLRPVLALHGPRAVQLRLLLPGARRVVDQATKEITRRLGVDEETAHRLWEGMSGTYELMAGKGLCACLGGEQSVRVIPEALELIRTRAAALPEAED
jgi:hypothetical protein